MTIIYQYRVATTSLGGFLKLLKAWRGSVYKLLYKELLIFVTLYAIISLVYRFGLNEDQRSVFEGIVLELYGSTSAIPLSFLLGFYVTFIAQRWWQQFTNVPWPDRTLFTMVAYLHGFDDRARMMRRSVARYMLFGLIWICRAISVTVMKRFPTLDHIVEAGFITKEEKVIFENTECKYQKFFVPMMWANQILVTARREGKIDTDFGLRMILQPLADFRDRLSLCFVYDWITVPLVYTQVVTFAVYSYFVVSLFGQQYLDPSKNYKGFEQDFYFPGFSILQFLFYMGWLKVAEQMINPFGEDDDDFDINWLLDRHTAVAFTLVDKCYGKHPDMVKDGFWNDVTPDVPYTESSAGSIRPNFLGSTFNIEPPSQEGDKLLIADRDNINQHEWTPRPRGRSFMADSVMSLFNASHLRHHPSGGSQSTLGSNGSGNSRNMSNGRAHYMMDKENGADGRIRRSSVDIPLRERASTDSDFRGRHVSQRKMSLPFSIHLFKNKQKKPDPLPAVGSPKSSRFTIEPVKEEATRRAGVPFQNVLSRMPALSAIEEGNTVTSIKQLMEEPAVPNSDDDFEAFIDSHETGVLSDDDERAYEDCISYVDETNSTLMNFETAASSDFSFTVSSPATATASFSQHKNTTATAATTKANTTAAEQLSALVQTEHSKPTTFIDTNSASSSQAVSTKSPRRGTTISEGKNISSSCDDSLTHPLLPISKKKMDLASFATNGQASSHSKTKINDELAPLIRIDDC